MTIFNKQYFLIIFCSAFPQSTYRALNIITLNFAVNGKHKRIVIPFGELNFHSAGIPNTQYNLNCLASNKDT